jgi:glutamine synthetase adenylyltransferase
MTATNQEYLQRLAEYPKQAWEQAEDWVSARFHRQPERKVSKAKIAGLAILGMGLLAGYYLGPDLMRYIRIRRM